MFDILAFTFTCPYGTSILQMLYFGLCNAPATFQQCMMFIHSNMVDTIVVLIDDYSVVGNSFDWCLNHLAEVLKICEDCNLGLN